MGKRNDYVLRRPTWSRVHDGPMPVRTHTGIGDTVLQAGLMVQLSLRYGRIAVPCYEKCLSLGHHLYQYFPNIGLYVIPNNHTGHLCSPPDSTLNAACSDSSQEIRIGDYAGDGLWEDFAKGFYLQSGVEYHHRWTSFPLHYKEILYLIPQRKWPFDGPRFFVHDDASRGYVIREMCGKFDKPYYRPEFTGNILEYAEMLITADELHLMDSSFFCLANQLPVTGKLFHYGAAKPGNHPREFRYDLLQNWHYI